jgi:NAD(P)H-flavin reductase/ferredoxin
MFGLFTSSKPKNIRIEGVESAIEIHGKETILSAALRQGIRFPHSCRVGGCATCKCKLTSGKVKELTESAYILSAEELDQGYILACQSVPKSDITIELDQLNAGSPQFTPKTFHGEVAASRRLTQDIAALDILLHEPIHYAAGQYALLSVPGQIDQGRSYSFAAAPSPQGTNVAQFYIRKVPGGAMSSWAQGDDIVGTAVSLNGPFGDFYLREGEQPIVCIAGGSGLAPVKALLEDALAFKNPRPVVFLFGARTQQDLYCLDQIKHLQSQWAGDFTFVPVLSEEPLSSDWPGARGLVTHYLEQYTTPASQVYMCGPPPMLDAAEQVLLQQGIAAEQIFSDKFFDQSSIAQ